MCSHEFVFNQETSGSYCKKCGLVEREYSLYGSNQYLVNGRMKGDEGEVTEQPRRPQGYTRISRFREITRQVFGLRGIHQKPLVSPALLRVARELCHKWRLTGTEITPSRLIYVFKKSRLGPLSLDRAACLAYKLGGSRDARTSGTEPTREVLARLEALFHQVDRAWPTVQALLRDRFGWSRVCFIGYSSLLKALLELMGENELAARVPPLKQSESKHRQTAIWATVCQTLGWTFLPITGNLLTPAGANARPRESHLLGSKPLRKKRKKTRRAIAAAVSGFKSSQF